MYSTLSALREGIDQLIASQGQDAVCAAFVFTKEDVFELNKDTSQIRCFPSLLNQDVLRDLGHCDYIYQCANEVIHRGIDSRKAMDIYQQSAE